MIIKKYKIVYCTPALYSAGGTERVVSIKANFMITTLRKEINFINSIDKVVSYAKCKSYQSFVGNLSFMI